MNKVACCWVAKIAKNKSRSRRNIATQNLIPFLFFLLFSTPSFSSDASDEAELNQLLDLLNQQTSIATRTQLNSDYVPGMVSIMTGIEMRQRGFATVWDALAYLPGIQLNMDATGKRNIIVRGLGKDSETSKIKIQLNGVSLNQSISAASETLFDTPVSQIEKIELVRGPGSAIHGEYALMGVLNVITIKHGKGVSVGSTSAKTRDVSLQYAVTGNDRLWQASVNIAATQSDGENIITTSDKTPSTIEGYAAGPINNKKDTVSAILDFSISDIDLSLQYQQSNRGDYYGANNYLPPPDKQTVISDTVASVKIADNFLIADSVKGQLSYTHLVNTTEKNQLFLGVAPVYGGVSSQDDIVSDISQQEQRGTLSLNLEYQYGAHNWFMEAATAQIDVEKSSQSINLDPVTHLPSNEMNAFPAPVDNDQERTINSLVLQDEYAINDAIVLTAGLRYDDFDGEYTNVSPRVAMVWILSNTHIVKFQYSEAFRPPSMREAGGAINGDIVPETNQTTEFSYIYNSDDTVIRNTIYYSKIDDYISFIDTVPYGYANIDGAELSGYELEIVENLTSKLLIRSNLTLQNSRDENTGQALYGSTPVIFTLSSQYSPSFRTNIDFELKSIGSQTRQQDDSRGDLQGFAEANITLTHKKLFNVDGLSIAGGVRNIFQQDIRYLAPKNTYADDYLASKDATWWLELEYRQ